MDAIQIDDLYFSYGDLEIFRGLSLTIPAGQVVAIQTGIVAPAGEGVEVERERLRLGEEQAGEGADPAGQQSPLLVAAGPWHSGRGSG